MADKCKATKPRCPKCAGEHEYGGCTAGAKVKCCNCGGEHSAAYQGCEVQKKAKEVQRYKVQNKVSYAEATEKVSVNIARKSQVAASIFSSEDFPKLPQAKVSSTKCSHKCVIEEDALIVNKYKFVAFIGKVVNVALQQAKKRSRLKTIVEAAGEFLGIKDITVEMIHDMLAPNNEDSQISE